MGSTGAACVGSTGLLITVVGTTVCVAGCFGDVGACSSILVSKYFLGCVADTDVVAADTVSNLLPLRGGMVGGLADRVVGVVRVDKADEDITGVLFVDCLVVEVTLPPECMPLVIVAEGLVSSLTFGVMDSVLVTRPRVAPGLV